MILNKNKGFTLIEIMIVVVIIGIIAAIALPYYGEYVNKGKRAGAAAELTSAAHQLERCFTTQNSYSGCTVTPEDEHYTFNSTINDQSYTLQAVPTFTDAYCGTLTLEHTGERKSGGSKDNSYCW